MIDKRIRDMRMAFHDAYNGTNPIVRIITTDKGAQASIMSGGREIAVYELATTDKELAKAAALGALVRLRERIEELYNKALSEPPYSDMWRK